MFPDTTGEDPIQPPALNFHTFIRLSVFGPQPSGATRLLSGVLLKDGQSQPSCKVFCTNDDDKLTLFCSPGTETDHPPQTKMRTNNVNTTNFQLLFITSPFLAQKILFIYLVLPL